MPMFICTLGREAINRLHATALIATITKLATVRSQRIPQLALLRRHTRVWFMVMHRKLFNRIACTSLGDTARLPDSIFKRAAKLAR